MFPRGELRAVVPQVNGTSLIELARRVELGPATVGGTPDRAGVYAGLVVGERADWAHWFLDDHPLSWSGDGDSCLLGRVCGDTGCRPLSATVTVTDREITWPTFRAGHRTWDLCELGPFVFLRSQYQAALDVASRTG